MYASCNVEASFGDTTADAKAQEGEAFRERGGGNGVTRGTTEGSEARMEVEGREAEGDRRPPTAHLRLSLSLEVEVRRS